MEQKNDHRAGFYERIVKRVFDIALSIAALIILSPVTLICIIAIKLDDVHGSVLFKQERNGRYGEVFKIVKFRTMKQELCGENIWATASTLTKAGKIIRLLSLDEIPQFVSILTGKMSFIGPRPLLLSYYEWYSETERHRFNVRPGLTGLSQINGRANLNWDERFALDVEYADNISFLLDMKIFFKTFGVILSHKDVLPEDDTPLEDFSEYRRKQLNKKKQIVTLSPPPENKVFESKRMQA
jgi:undecaprenyl phosphate N,N'-diacetylbacillosamine 1-phosphate transferase